MENLKLKFFTKLSIVCSLRAAIYKTLDFSWTLKQQKLNLLKEEIRELESIDDEFYFHSFNTDFDRKNDNICPENNFSSDSNSDVVPVKR